MIYVYKNKKIQTNKKERQKKKFREVEYRNRIAVSKEHVILKPLYHYCTVTQKR